MGHRLSDLPCSVRGALLAGALAGCHPSPAKAPQAAKPPPSAAPEAAAVHVETVALAPASDKPDPTRLGLHVLVADESRPVVVRDRRRLILGKGGLRMTLRGVPRDLEPTTVSIRTLTNGAHLELVDVRFYDGQVTPAALLAPYAGKPVVAYLWDQKGSGEERQPATLLGVSESGPVVSVDRQTRLLEFGRVAVPALPEGLRPEPTLELVVSSDRDTQDVELTYSCHSVRAGMQYQLFHVPGAATAQVTGLLGVSNESGVPLSQALVTLTSEVDEPTEFAETETAGDKSATTEAQRPAKKQPPSTTFVRWTSPLSLAIGERALLRLFGPTETRLTRKVVVEGPGLPIAVGESAYNASIRAVLDAESLDEAPLSEAGLVGGQAQLFERLASEPPRAYGTAAARPLPGARGLRVDLGTENQYPASRRLVSRRSLGRCTAETAWEVTVSNPTEAPVLVEDVEPVTGKYRLIDSSVPAIATEADHFVFAMTVPPGGQSTLKFRVRTMGCVMARRHYWQPSWNKGWGKQSWNSEARK
ncbi:MAG: hypothetical protein JW940_21355 [Polyangiaceae bacterium]|nr:hypothetical protein [Polyangiaceae bacterium]